MNTIGDMQNEKDFYGHCKKFVYNQDYVKFSSQVVGVNICVNILIPT